MQKVLRWGAFYRLSEIYTAPLNIIWFIFGAAIAYSQYHVFNLINVILCTLTVFLFDLAVNIADNYFDYRHGTDPHFLSVINPIGYLNLPAGAVGKLAITMYLVSAIPGILLVARTGWLIFWLGVVGYAVGIFYTAGPKPLNATPFCEAIVSFFIAFFTVLVSVAVSIYGSFRLTWSLAGRVLLLCLPLMLLFYAFQLANNACDLDEDLANGRKTLVAYIGRKRAMRVVQWLTVVGMLFPLILAACRLTPWPMIFSSLILLLMWRPLQEFLRHPDKHTTYLGLIKGASLFFLVYILLYTLLVVW